MRIQWIDSLKGFLIFLVVLGHVVQSAIDSNVFFQSKDILRVIFNWIYSFHMPLFFVISGYLYKCSWKDRVYAIDFWKLLLKKELNLIILYLGFSFLLGLLKICVGGNVKEPVGIYDLIMIPVNPISVFWFLHVLIIFFFIFPCLERLHYNYTNYKSMLVLLLISCFSALVILPFDINKIFTHMFFFALGSSLFKTTAVPNVRYISVVTVIGIVLSNFFVENVVLHTVVSVLWTLFFYTVFILKEKTLSNTVIMLLGKECLVIYLLHPFLVAIFKFTILKKIDSAIIYCITATMMTIGIVIIISYFLRKIGCYDYIFNPGKKMMSRFIFKSWSVV